jgi:ubiquinone/menaquinone biosynthesis C-methylase UbiE
MRNDIWRLAPSLTLKGITRSVPLTNFAGRNYMAYVDHLLQAQLAIRGDERVLDIGGGATPFSRADVVTEAFIDDDTHRIGQPIRKDRKYVKCFAERLPFEDREFDVAISRHVFEHAVEPEAACREMARVARRGYIETPSLWSEYFYGYPPHRWLISVEDGVLVFRRRPFVRSPFLNCLRWMEYRDADFSFRWNLEFRNLITTQYPWEGEILVRVEAAAGFDYDDADQAAESHLSFVINALRFGGVPPVVLEYEARAAVRLRPECALAHNTLGVILWQAKRFEEGKKAFLEAERLDPHDDVFHHNARISAESGQRIVKFLASEPLDNELPQENFDGPVFYSSRREHETILANQLGISQEDNVLDITRGADPFGRANLVLDVGHEMNPHSKEDAICPGSHARASAAGLPIPDKAADFVIVRDILEHARDPLAMCSEIQRVAKRGFIEVPSPCWEYVYGDPGHRWLCKLRDGVLLFKRKRFAKNPFRSVLAPLLSKLPELRHRFEITLRNVTFVQMLWNQGFECRVEEDPDCPYDYDRDNDALLAHLDFGYNLLMQGAPSLALPEADAVLAIRPDHADGLNIRGLSAWKLGRRSDAIEYLRRAVEAAPGNRVVAENYRVLRQKYAEISRRGASESLGD